MLTWDASGRFDNAVLIREIRAGSTAVHQPALCVTDLVGAWQGEEVAVSRPCGAFSSEVVLQRRYDSGGGSAIMRQRVLHRVVR